MRWLAPGDDVSYPFASKQHLFHAESSGASAIAAGVLLLVLGSNPSLRLPELHAVLARTVDAPEPEPLADSPVADPADLLPHGRDRDGHNARTGYGRLNAAAACAIASDPLALAIAAIGEARAAVGWCKHEGRPYSKRCARWVVRVLLARPDLEHGVRALARHLRLLAAKPSRASGHAPEALVRQLGTFARELSRLRPPRSVRSELEHLGRQLAGALAGDGTAPGRLTDAAVRSIFADLRPELAQRLHGPVSDARAQS